MKAGWSQKTIADVCSVVNGGTPKTGVTEYWDGLHQWITPAEMGKRSTPYVSSTERTITDAGLQNSSARLLPPFSVILSSRAPIGHLVINTEPMATNQGCKGLVPSADLNHKYLYYYLSSIVQLLNDLGTGATFKELSGGKLKEVAIPLPSLSEQQRIVSVLDEAFAGIATARTNAEKNRQNARALFESHLNAIFSQRGARWEERPLGEVADLLDCLHKTPTYCEIGFPMVRVTDIKPGFLDLSKARRVDEQTFVEFSKRYTPKVGDIVFSRVGSCGVSALVSSDEPFCLGQNTVFILPKMNPTLLYYFLNSPPAKGQLERLTEGTTQPTISMKSIRTVRVCIPPAGDQERIVTSLNAANIETQRLESLYQRKLAALDELKQSLLHQAFSGQL
ncbi:restriction endonuclease subunit S [Permianibacter sp. IMCC34836]|uniref:restriction endonuclease subunit S n=1 Tax=Permianibacter fluminis TaxID=2738515 RepID=UPI001557863C|nr:restriction endonuclease subunit S [Permianibacter fluminis]NQD35978.1 restriction endonuclease subunit S [Permianibacter fluminis]